MVACVADGTFIKLPDRYGDQQGQVSGYQAADLFKRAMNGDRGALADLLRYQDYASNPWFAKALLAKLGPIDLVKLPVQLARLLRGDINDHSKNLNLNAEDTRAALALLGKALATGTRPLTSGYMGDQFLKDLQAAGRTGFPPGGPNHIGYQGLSAILEATGGTVRYSEAFMRTVGRDMINHALANEASGWKPTPDVADLTDIGTLLDQPGHENSSPGDYLTGLLTVAGATREGSQALLDYTPPGAKTTNLYYLLHDRREAWGATDRGAALGQAIKAAASGRDGVSMKLFTEIQNVYGVDVLKSIKYADGHSLAVEDLDRLNQLSGLRLSMAGILIGHLDDIANQLAISGASFEADAPAKARLLLAVIGDTVQDDQAFEALTKAHVARLRIAIELQARTGSDDEVLIYAKAMGRLLALRTELTAAPANDVNAENEKIKSFIDDGLGWVTISGYLEKFGISPQTAGYVDGKMSERLGDLIFSQLGDHSQDSNTESSRVANEDPFYRLVSQMLVTSTAANLKYDPKSMHGRSFVKDGKILPTPWTDAQLADFYKWSKDHNIGLITLQETLRGTISGAHDETVDAFAEGPKKKGS